MKSLPAVNFASETWMHWNINKYIIQMAMERERESEMYIYIQKQIGEREVFMRRRL